MLRNTLKLLVSLCLFLALNDGLYSQSTTVIAPGAINQIETLLNRPAIISPAVVTPLGWNWFRIETDFHVFSTLASFQQVSDTLLDLENIEAIYSTDYSRLVASIISRSGNEAIIDYISISIGPFGCMPSRVAESILKKEMNVTGKSKIKGWEKKAYKYADIGEFPFLAVETDGSPFPQLIEANLEAFVLQAGRLHNFHKSL
jgi:hypothetical protein